MPRTHHPPSTRGYTLVELLVIIMILGLIASMVIPSLSSAGVLRTQGAVRSVVADITYAQSDALAYQQGRAIVFDTLNNKYTICEYEGGAVDVSTDALFDHKGPGSRYERSLDDGRFGGAHLVSPSFNGGVNLLFDELGSPAGAGASLSTGGTVEVHGGDGKKFRITVGAFTGRVTVAELP